MCHNKNNKTNDNVIRHSDHRSSVIVGEINSRKQVFNIQSSGTKPYDTSNMLKPSGSNNHNKWGDLYRRIFIIVKKHPNYTAIFFTGILGYTIIFIS